LLKGEIKMADPVVVPAPAPKKPWESKTVMIATVMGLLTVLVPFIPGMQAYSDWINTNGVAISGIWTVLAVVLRFVTKGAVSLED
jgi:hypothetical protein